MRAFGFSTLAILGCAAGSVDARAYTPRSSRALGGLLARQTTSDTCANVNGVVKVNVQGSLVSIGQISMSARVQGHAFMAHARSGSH